jgi:D-cysteine desulfhydrase family pyridoxal phosphate-dependent enzyme
METECGFGSSRKAERCRGFGGISNLLPFLLSGSFSDIYFFQEEIMPVYSASDLRSRIERFPKKNLIHLPTPFYKLDNLSKVLDGPDIYIKRDDMTGLAFGGNKSRKLEFIIQDIIAKNKDAVITWASVQSNWCLQTSAAAQKFGIKPILILYKDYNLPYEADGNLLLDIILNAEIRIEDTEKGKVIKEKDVRPILEEAASDAEKKGFSPYIAPIGGSLVGGSMDIPLGAIGYVEAFAELKEQAEALSLEIDHVVFASGSGGTQAGLTVGAKAISKRTQILGISVSEEKVSYGRDIHKASLDTAKALELNIEIDRSDIMIFDGYIKEGYGIVDKEISDTLRITAKNEGIFLDPVYTGKAMCALMDLINKNYFRKDEKIVFFHTGGTPALFPNKHLITHFLKREMS